VWEFFSSFDTILSQPKKQQQISTRSQVYIFF
jgi:hypothetical protein